MKIKAQIETGDAPLTLNLRGRLAWTMLELIKAGDIGITPLHSTGICAVVHFEMTHLQHNFIGRISRREPARTIFDCV